jgi:hypothetical protein
MKRWDRELIVLAVLGYQKATGNFGAARGGRRADALYQQPEVTFQFVVRRPMP